MLMIMILNDDDKSDDKYDDNFKNAQECCSEKSGGEAGIIIMMLNEDDKSDDN